MRLLIALNLCLFVYFGHLFVPINSDSHSRDDGLSGHDNAIPVVAKSIDNANNKGVVETKTVKPENPTDNLKKVNGTTDNKNSTVDCENGQTNCTNNDKKTLYGKFITKITENKGMLLRTMYVLIALTSIIVIYFMIRSFRLRHKRNKSRKYGLITAPNDLEMAPLDQDDDDDDDMTVFEMNGMKK
ncbi:hypothetical protein SNE40_012144 [Patella caerulea]|uniref:Uncharacterized protein n=1 Tax=Patella caerulea TaxID=87958 RepID=A0AAN8PL47_PATCE